jgi:hypothetical protein
MKAIINVNKNNQYSKYNGLTFDVKEILNSIVSLDVNGITTDFSFNEVMIVDFQEELQKAYDDFNWDGSSRRYSKLLKYQDFNGLKPIKLTYNCPA